MLTRKALLIAIACVLAGGARSSRAQQADPLLFDVVPRVRVEVTGSRVARLDAETALPVQVIDREEIRRNGWTTAADLMAHVSANLVAFNDQMSVGADDVAGHAYANLRGLGPTSTLILLNGRRLANYAFGGFGVDLNSIPLAALDRVEILKDGASSIYGTDAIAGVVNFITRKDYRGFDATVNGSATEHGGASHRQLTLSGGYGDLAKDRFNTFLTVDWQKDDGLAARDRPFSSTSYIPAEGIDRLSSSTVPANIYLGNGAVVSPAADSGCAPPASLLHTRRGRLVCGYDFSSIIDDIPPTERANVLGRTTLALAPDNELYAEYVYTWNKLVSHIAPSVIALAATASGDPIFYPANGPYYPIAFAAANGLSGDLPIAYRLLPLGPRIAETQTNATRLVLGDHGEWHGWQYDGGVIYSENTARTIYRSGYVSSSALASAVYSGLINVFGDLDSTGGSLLESTQIGGQVRRATAKVEMFDAHASRELFELAGGPVSMALGTEARHEHLADDPGDLLSSGDILGGVSPIQPQAASRRVVAAYAEFILPLTKQIEAQLSVRYDHYSDFGGTTNPKLAVRWQPMRELLFRGSVGTGFRAPTLTEAYTPRYGTFEGGQQPDPVRCPVTQTDEDCNVAYVVINGGNPLLQPEKSTQFTAGGLWEPVPGTSIALDYWRIDKRHAIDQLEPDFVLSNFDALAPTNVIRGPVDPAFPNLPGPIVSIVGYPQNFGNVRAAGIDVDLVARTPANAFGHITLRLNGSLLTSLEESILALSTQSALGARTSAGAVPRWRHYAAATWERGPWGATLAQTFQTGYTDENILTTAPPRNVGSYSVWDLQGTYTGFRSISLTAGIRNLFDRDPPFTNQADLMQVGYEPSYADPRGRVYYATLRYSFK